MNDFYQKLVSTIPRETSDAFYHAQTLVMFDVLASSSTTITTIQSFLDKGKVIFTGLVVSSARSLQTATLVVIGLCQFESLSSMILLWRKTQMQMFP